MLLEKLVWFVFALSKLACIAFTPNVGQAARLALASGRRVGNKPPRFRLANPRPPWLIRYFRMYLTALGLS